MPTNDAPVLRQNVRWGEEYVSRGLNIKMAGIIQPGVYHGFVLKPGGSMAVLVDHAPNYPRSVAVVERDGFSLTVVMDDPGMVSIPAKGTWYVCVEALYSPTHQGYQRIVVRERPEHHHVVLGKVYAGTLVAPPSGGGDGSGGESGGENPPDESPTVVIREEMITTEERGEANADIATIEQMQALSEQVTAGMDSLIGEQAETIANVLRLATRLTTHSLSNAGAGTTVIVDQGNGGTSISPDGTTVGPVAIGASPSAVGAGAAMTLIVEPSGL